MLRTNMMGIISLNDDENYLGDIVRQRLVGAVPFGGRYRIIDFVLSNMVNSGIQNVGVMFGTKARSLMDHLRSGKDWDLHRKRDGLYMLPVDRPPGYEANRKNDLDNLYQHLDYLYEARQDYVLLTKSYILCNIDFQKVFDFHLEAGADITVVYKKEDLNSGRFSPCHCVTLKADSEQNVQEMEINPVQALSEDVSMEMYIFKKTVLINLIESCVAKGQRDLLSDGIIPNLNQLRVCAYRFPGYVARINSLKSYFHYSMDLLQPQVLEELFFANGPIHTKVKNSPPAKYTTQAEVVNSLVAPGCIIQGGVENCILFRGVRIHPGVHLKNCVILPESEVMPGSILENVIMDKKTCISAGREIRGEYVFPVYIGKSVLV